MNNSENCHDFLESPITDKILVYSYTDLSKDHSLLYCRMKRLVFSGIDNDMDVWNDERLACMRD